MKYTLRRMLTLVPAILLLSGCGKQPTPPVLSEAYEPPAPSYCAHLTLVGDLLYEQPYYDALDAGDDPAALFAQVMPYFERDDLTVGNMEVVISDGTLPVSGGEEYSFCAPRSIGEQVVAAGFDVLSTANNHANDRGKAGRDATVDFLAANGVLPVGSFPDEAARSRLAVKEVNGIRFGFLAYTTFTNENVESELRWSLGLCTEPESGAVDEALLVRELSEARGQCDVLTVLMHWGTEFTFEPDSQQRELARILCENGADLIVGSHSHCIQPVETLTAADGHETLVFYSLGNFVSADDDVSRADETFDNAYQFGLLAELTVRMEDGRPVMEDIATLPVVNYYDSALRGFALVPLDRYDTAHEQSHYRYPLGLSADFIRSTYETVIAPSYR